MHNFFIKSIFNKETVHQVGKQDFYYIRINGQQTIKICTADWVQINKPKSCIFLVINYEVPVEVLNGLMPSVGHQWNQPGCDSLTMQVNDCVFLYSWCIYRRWQQVWLYRDRRSHKYNRRQRQDFSSKSPLRNGKKVLCNRETATPQTSNWTLRNSLTFISFNCVPFPEEIIPSQKIVAPQFHTSMWQRLGCSTNLNDVTSSVSLKPRSTVHCATWRWYRTQSRTTSLPHVHPGSQNEITESI